MKDPKDTIKEIRERTGLSRRDFCEKYEQNIADIIFVGTRLTVDDDAEHFKNGVSMAVERRALQRVAVGHAVVNPFPVQFLERQFTTASERIDEPNVLMENLRYFHKI